MSLEALPALLVVVGWIVSFLLGRELAAGFLHWRARSSRSTRLAARSDLDRDRRSRS